MLVVLSGGFNTLCGVLQGGDMVVVSDGINIWNWTWDSVYILGLIGVQPNDGLAKTQ